MTGSADRWIEVSRSQFEHEAEGLRLVRDMLPMEAPFRAWSNFEFRDRQGMWHEVDLLVLGRRRLQLVELKYYRGVLRGDDLIWRRDGHQAEDSPLKLAHRKAQRLASKLQDEIRSVEKGEAARAAVPFVQASVFLHHPGIRCKLPSPSRADLFGQDELETATGLPGISRRLLEPATDQQSVGANREVIIAALMARIGIVRRQQREVGSWVIDEQELAEGDGWQDWPAFHRVASNDRARIRFLVTAPGTSEAAQAKLRRIAEHEYWITSRLANDHLLRPRDMVENELGVGLVYPLDDRFRRLDLWLADQGGQVADVDRRSVLRQVAEAVAYAHANRIVHRGLTPHAVLVRSLPDGGVRVMVAGWQSGGTVTGTAVSGLPPNGITSLLGIGEKDSQTTDRPNVAEPASRADVDMQSAEAYQAPEGVFTVGADRIRLDVFALGALAYFVLSGHRAASGRAVLRERLHRDGGLDLEADWPDVPDAVRALVLESTRPTVSERLPDVRSFLERLAAAERALTDPAKEVADPLETSPGSVIDRRFRLERRLGEGSTAVGLLVRDLTMAHLGPGAVRVLKIAVDDAAAARLVDEAEVLVGLNSPRIVRLVEGPVEVGGRQALVLESAGEETLAEVLYRGERPPWNRLERWGTDLLEALVALHRAGVNHRDIKPANLGIRREAEDRAKHLVLFDFSLSRADASAVTAGTPPYLDPFLGGHGRGRFDSAAERYSAAVVLFEMATGTVPQFGDGLSDPASVLDEAAVEAHMFDATAADALVAFFRAALARAVQERHKSAEEMLTAWRAVFASAIKTIPAMTGSRAAAEQSRLVAVSGPGAQLSRGEGLLGSLAGVGRAGDGPGVGGGGVQGAIFRPVRGDEGIGAAESVPEPTGSIRKRMRSRRAVVALAAALILGLGATIGVVLASSHNGSPASHPVAEASYAFPPQHYDGLLVIRRWTLRGKNGSLLIETVTATSTTGKPVRAQFEEAIPAAIAPSLQTVRFTPAPAKIVRADPIIAWDIRLSAHGMVTVGYQAQVPAVGATKTRLIRWAQALVHMEAQLALEKGRHVPSKRPSASSTASSLPPVEPRSLPSTAAPTWTAPSPVPTPQPAAVPILIGNACSWAYPGQASGNWNGSGYGIVCLDANGQSLGGFPDGSGHSLNDWCADPSHTDGDPNLIQAKLTSTDTWVCTTVQ